MTMDETLTTRAQKVAKELKDWLMGLGVNPRPLVLVCWRMGIGGPSLCVGMWEVWNSDLHTVDSLNFETCRDRFLDRIEPLARIFANSGRKLQPGDAIG